MAKDNAALTSGHRIHQTVLSAQNSSCQHIADRNNKRAQNQSCDEQFLVEEEMFVAPSSLTAEFRSAKQIISLSFASCHVY